jgi:hypothetical protein
MFRTIEPACQVFVRLCVCTQKDQATDQAQAEFFFDSGRQWGSESYLCASVQRKESMSCLIDVFGKADRAHLDCKACQSELSNKNQ